MITYSTKRRSDSVHRPRKRTKTTTEISDGDPRHPPSTPKADITYLSRTPTPSPKAPNSESDPFTPKKPAKDLSRLFDFPQTPSQSTKPGGSGLAKRMLSRSRTESSLESNSPNQSPARSHSQPSFTPYSKPYSRSPSPSKLFPPLPPPVPVPSASASISTTHARTYAGKSRTFLISLPASSLASGLPRLEGDDDFDPLAQQDASETRESYTDLRTRYGVDNSEDDPYPSPSSSPANSQPQQSRAHSRAHSPTKPSKGKGKTKEQIVYQNGLTNDLKSITELRSKGESRRFLDEVGYLFEGMEPSGGIGVRRASALEIVTKLCSPDFARKAKAADFHTRAWEVFFHSLPATFQNEKDKDKILCSMLAFFAALIAEDSASLVELAQAENTEGEDIDGGDFVGTLVELLGSSFGSRAKDVLGLVGAGVSDVELKKAGVARTEKVLLTKLNNTISQKSGIFSPTISISTCLLLTHALSALPPSALPPHHLPTILHTLRSELHLIPPRINAYISGLSLFPPPSPTSYADTPSFEHIENCLRLLDSFLLGQWGSPVEDDDEGKDMSRGTVDAGRKSGLGNELVALSVIAELMMQFQDNDSDKYTIAIKCTETAFRVLLSLTQDNPDWCQALLEDELALPLIMRMIMRSHSQRCSAFSNKRASEEPLAAEDDNDAQILDRLCLALGLLTNLVQVSDIAKDLMRQTRLDPACIGKRTCIRACQCSKRVSALECLTRVYVQQSKDSSDIDPGANFLRGHIAVLLGLLMRDNKTNQKVLLATLPGHSSSQKLASLGDQAREFVTFYDELVVRLSTAATARDKKDEDNNSPTPHSDHRKVERIVKDGSGNVAREVIAFLEKLSVQQMKSSS